MKSKKVLSSEVALFSIISLAALMFTNSNVFGAACPPPSCPATGNPFTIAGITTLANDNEFACSNYQFQVTLPGNSQTAMAQNTTVTINFPAGDPCTVASGDVNGTPIDPLTFSCIGTILQFDLPVDICQGTTMTINLSCVTNPSAGTFTTLTMTAANCATGTNTFDGFSYTIVAQQFWRLDGNDITATDFIGTRVSSIFKDFVVKTKEIERMRVIGDGPNEGNIGIGAIPLTDVTSLLGVKGNTAIGATFYNVVGGAPVNGLIVEGNTGIGIAAPAAKLDVLDATIPQLRLTQDAVNNVFTEFQTTAIGDLFINPENNGVPGNVGIGTPTPSVKLHLDDETAGNTNDIFQLFTNTGATIPNGFRLGITNTGIAEVRQRENQPMQFFTNDQQRMIIEAAGNVGIGIPTPGFKLDVAGGSINTDSDYRINGLRVLSIPGPSNVFVGDSTGHINTGSFNTFVGRAAGSFNTIGSANTFVGRWAGRVNSTGDFNAFLGTNAGLVNTSGALNTFIGGFTGLTNTTGDNNTYIGFFARGTGPNLTNATAIGANAFVSTSNSLVLGNNVVNVGIGVTAPLATLHVVGDFRLNDGTEGPDFILTTDDQGNASWTDPADIIDDGDWAVSVNGNVFTGITGFGVPTGNVGIGTASPGAKLHIEGDFGAFIDNGLRIQAKLQDTPWNIYQGSGPLRFAYGNSNKVSIDINGNVGIGTISPNAPLSVVGNAFLLANGGLNALEIRSSGVPARRGIVLDADPSGRMIFYGHSFQSNAQFEFRNALDNSTAMTIKTTGRVGIGITNPQAHLHVSGSGNQFIDITSTDAQASHTRLMAVTSNGITESQLQFKGRLRFVAPIGGPTVKMTIFENGNVGIGTETQQGCILGICFNCKLNVAGLVCSFGVPLLSDQSIKKNVTTLTNSLEKIKKLRGVNFEWDLNPLPDSLHMVGTQIGLIAQEVDTVIPEVIFQADSGTLSVDYTRIIPVLIEAIKELHALVVNLQYEIDSLIPDTSSVNARLDAIEACINNLPPGLCGGNNFNKTGNNSGGFQQNSTGNNFININSTVQITPDNSLNSKSTQLYQNQPNPFRYSTKFSYAIGIPGNVELFVTSYTGQYITTLVNERQS